MSEDLAIYKPKTCLDTDHAGLLSRKCFLNPTKYTAELERKGNPRLQKQRGKLETNQMSTYNINPVVFMQ